MSIGKLYIYKTLYIYKLYIYIKLYIYKTLCVYRKTYSSPMRDSEGSGVPSTWGTIHIARMSNPSLVCTKAAETRVPLKQVAVDYENAPSLK